MPLLNEKTIGRLSIYRRVLTEAAASGVAHLFSHELANVAGVSSAQVRRDLMAVGYNGTPTRGYAVGELVGSIAALLDGPRPQGLALIGMGNLGGAILAHFKGRHPNLSFVAAFDSDPAKVGRVLQGCRCHAMSDLARVVRGQSIRVAVLAVPVEDAQEAADQAVEAGITGILNLAPVTLRLPPHVHVEHNDLTTSIERVAFFAQARPGSQGSTGREGSKSSEGSKGGKEFGL